MKDQFGVPSIGVERADGRRSPTRSGLWNVVVRRGEVRVVIPLGLPRSQAATLAAQLGDVLRPDELVSAELTPGQLALL